MHHSNDVTGRNENSFREVAREKFDHATELGFPANATGDILSTAVQLHRPQNHLTDACRLFSIALCIRRKANLTRSDLTRGYISA